MANEIICGNLDCEYYENGYCWGYGWPVKELEDDACDEHRQWNKRNNPKTLDTQSSSTTIPKNPNKNKNEVWRKERT